MWSSGPPCFWKEVHSEVTGNPLLSFHWTSLSCIRASSTCWLHEILLELSDYLFIYLASTAIVTHLFFLCDSRLWRKGWIRCPWVTSVLTQKNGMVYKEKHSFKAGEKTEQQVHLQYKVVYRWSEPRLHCVSKSDGLTIIHVRILNTIIVFILKNLEALLYIMNKRNV